MTHYVQCEECSNWVNEKLTDTFEQGFLAEKRLCLGCSEKKREKE